MPSYRTVSHSVAVTPTSRIKASHGLITCFTSATLVNIHGVQKSLYCRDMSDIESKVLDELRACHSTDNEGKGKAVPLQALSGPEGSTKLRFPDFTTTAQDGSKVVSLKHRPISPTGNTPCTHFC